MFWLIHRRDFWWTTLLQQWKAITFVPLWCQFVSFCMCVYTIKGGICYMFVFIWNWEVPCDSLLIKCIIDITISWESKIIPFESGSKFWDLYMEQANSIDLLVLSTTFQFKKRTVAHLHIYNDLMEGIESDHSVWPLVITQKNEVNLKANKVRYSQTALPSALCDVTMNTPQKFSIC